MISLGNSLLAIASLSSLVALVGCLWPWLPGRRAGSLRTEQVVRAGLAAAALAGVVATVVLAIAVTTVDLDLAYVVEHSRNGATWPYRLAALWGGAEGSLLLFSAGLAAVVAGDVNRPRSTAGRPSSTAGRPSSTAGRSKDWRQSADLTVASVLVFGYFLAVFVAANPFERSLAGTIRGTGLTPILEHPAMLWHPPLLYVGLILTVVPALVALRSMAALRRGGAAAPLERIRRHVLAAAALLTAGLLTGSHWAYAELGWGGYWGWDPVENTALIVWLMLLGALHLLARGRQRRGPWARQRGALLMVALPLPAALFGSTVTRSGQLSSVHAFADSAPLAWILGATTVAVTALVVATGWKIHQPESSEPEPSEPESTVGSQAVASISPAMAVGVAALSAAVVAVGVSAPLVAELVAGRAIVIESWFFSRMLFPLAVVALVGTVGAVVFQLRGRYRPRSRNLAMLVAHIGFAVLAIGVALTTTEETLTQAMAIGDQVQVGDTTVTYQAMQVIDGPRFWTEAAVAQVRVETGSSTVVLKPSLVSLPLDGVTLPEVATQSSWTRDVQVFVRSTNRDGVASFEIAVRPGMRLVWLGASLMALALATGAARAARVGQALPVTESAAA